mgnify:CR=1 FL=1
MHLEFFGAAGEVTGSCHILTVAKRTVLLDCGLIQGGRSPDKRNREDFPFDAAGIDAVVLSHAHIDHCGRLPLLRKRGFRGPIFATAASRDIARILLADSANLAQRDAERINRKRARNGDERRLEPLYTDYATNTWSGGTLLDSETEGRITTVGLRGTLFAGGHAIKGGLEYRDINVDYWNRSKAIEA